jgi:hypothetical protein
LVSCQNQNNLYYSQLPWLTKFKLYKKILYKQKKYPIKGFGLKTEEYNQLVELIKDYEFKQKFENMLKE